MATFDDAWLYRVLYNDGEGVDPTDLNHQQGQHFPNILASLGIRDACSDDPVTPGTLLDFESSSRTLGDLTDYVQDLVFTPSPDKGFWFPSGTRVLALMPGPICGVFDEPSLPIAGSYDPTIQWVMFGDYGSMGGQTLTTAIGHATLPRIDVVEIKIEYVNGSTESRDFKDATTGVVTTTTPSKKRTARITYQIKEGTPGATPAYPTVTAGFKAMCAVYVPALHNAAHDAANIRDLRWPMKLKTYDVPAHLMNRYGASPWTLNTTDFHVTAGAGASFLYVFPPSTSKNERLIGVGLYAEPNGTSTAVLERQTYDGGIPTLTSLCNLNANDELMPSGDIAGYRTITAVEMMGNMTGFTGTRAANTRIGTPLWMNGTTGGTLNQRTTNGGNTTAVAIKLSGDASKVWFLRFYVACGLFG